MKRSGRKSAAQTPAPKSERIKGSKRNPKGSAASSESANKINLSDNIVAVLKDKADAYNEKHPKNKVSVSTLKAVFRRGAGAYSSSHRPTITGGRPNSRTAWAYARVNKFLLKKGGTKVKAAYVQDDDLMAKGAILGSSCKTYIANNESVLKTGYYLNLSDFSSMIDPYGQIPLNLNYTLVTYNSGNQDGLSLIDTINPINLQNELAEILNISINNAQVVVGLYIEMGEKLKSISQIESDNIIIIDRDKVVCKSNTNKLYHLGGDMSKHLAPNGKPSNLTHEQWHLVRTPEFKAWFGDWENDPDNSSKVVDENGEPLVVWHGTYIDNPFYIFDFEKADLGFHFGTYQQAKNRSKTKLFFKGHKSIVKPFFLNIKTIFETTDVGEWEYPQRYIDMLVSDNLITESDAKKNGFYRIFYKKDYKLVREYLIKKYTNSVGFNYENEYEGKGKSFIVLTPNQIKLADGSNTTFDGNNPDIRYEDGGKIFKPTLSVQDIARKHNVTVSEVLKKLTLGIEKELEHTEDEEVAKIIASHHVEENIEYYDVLKENELEEGAIIEDIVIEEKPKVALPDTYADVESLKGILAMQGYEIKPIAQAENEENEEIMKKGGVVVGKSHQESDENGTGEKFVVASTGQIVELEGGEAVIVNKAMDSSEMLNFEGKEMTPKEIASYLNHAYGGVKFEQGGEVTCGCSHKKYYHGGELPSAVVDGLQGGEAVITKKTMESNEKYMFEGQKLTPRQILSRINHKYGGVSFARGGITGRVKHSEENKISKMIYFINNVNYG